MVRKHYINDAKKMLKSCPDLKIIGITGSYGKTSMKFFLTTLLKGKYDVLMTPESYNTPMGVVKTIRGSLKGYHEIFVCEMGAYRVGEIDELCRIANEILEKSELAKYDEYTSIDRDTFDYWSDGSAYVSEKFYIYFTFTQNGGWFINNDMVDFSDSRGISEVEEFTFECNIHIKDGEVVEVLYNDMPDNYNADMIDVPALTEYIEKLAAPVAGDIYNGTTNI
jgi:UDP-N-acetylmuramoylalanine-D-glutamate ligase